LALIAAAEANKCSAADKFPRTLLHVELVGFVVSKMIMNEFLIWIKINEASFFDPLSFELPYLDPSSFLIPVSLTFVRASPIVSLKLIINLNVLASL
jgi:hypothetical protein